MSTRENCGDRIRLIGDASALEVQNETRDPDHPQYAGGLDRSVRSDEITEWALAKSPRAPAVSKESWCTAGIASAEALQAIWRVQSENYPRGNRRSSIPSNFLSEIPSAAQITRNHKVLSTHTTRRSFT
jgi:hypothetical protein